MAGKFDNQDEGFNDINITPFVDVVLVLLVIFMVTAPAMMREELKVNLPKTLTSELSAQSSSVGIAVTREGQIVMDGKMQSEEAFRERLADYAANAPETQFLLSADVDARHGDVVKVIDALKKNNLSRFALQVEKIQERSGEP